MELERVDDLAAVRAEWDGLAEGAGHPFATWEWADAWWRNLAGGRELYTFAARDATGAARAILPMYVAARRPLPVARFFSGWADLQSPVCLPEDRPLAAAALLEATKRPHGCRVVIAEKLPGDQGWGELLPGVSLRHDDAPRLQIRGRTWEEFMATKKRKFRGNLRRAETKLIDEHGLAYRLADDPERFDEDFATLARLHSARWGGATTGVLEGTGAQVHREFARATLDRGWMRLWFAELDGKPAAAWYGWRFAGVDWHYQSGRDPAFDDLSVGTALLVHTLREAFGDGMEAYNFLAGAEGYKMHFADENPGAQSTIVGSGPVGGAAARALKLGFSLSGGARSRIARIAGRGGSE